MLKYYPSTWIGSHPPLSLKALRFGEIPSRLIYRWTVITIHFLLVMLPQDLSQPNKINIYILLKNSIIIYGKEFFHGENDKSTYIMHISCEIMLHNACNSPFHSVISSWFDHIEFIIHRKVCEGNSKVLSNFNKFIIPRWWGYFTLSKACLH